ncbi:hypothetical protein LPJ53_004128 [Coemansia erecta]|uniref:Pentatricopeptide repeat-containing protein-mitochondrial domain-containing protein n=1 Tax=Coemansia erecta TaxID=147472 RepID=A0A9W7XUZ3_9FUNG|nr:hypothetical protein LPJ53_004128 [Coemansia erecta]
MLGRLTRAARGLAPLRRRTYSTGLMDDDVVAALASDSSLTSRVQAIVHPSTYDQIARTKEVAQNARVLQRDTGQQLFADAQQQRATLGARLWELYKQQRQQRADEMTAEDHAALLSGFSSLRDGVGCAQVLQDMRLAGHTVDAAQLQAALHASTTAPAVLAVGRHLPQKPDAALDRLYHARLVGSLARAGQAEYAWAVALSMQARGVPPDSECVRPLVVALADAAEPSVALRAAQWGEAHGVALPPPVLLRLLRSVGRHSGDCAAFAELWHRLRACAGPGELPVEEDCLAGLRLAARSGDHGLAQSIVGHLRARGFPLRDFYVEALVLALARAGLWARAFEVLAEARAAGACRSANSVRGLARLLADTRASDSAAAATAADADAAAAAELGDRAFAALQQTPASLAADSVTLDALVSGIASAGHPAEALSRLQSWYDELSQRRTLSSYTGVLRACIYPSNQRVAEQLLRLMLDADGLEPSADVLEMMVRVSLGQFNYEDAFVYLDAIKAAGRAPQWATYAALARRCAVAGDPRAAVALREMRELGLPVTDALQAYVDARGRSPRHEARSRGSRSRGKTRKASREPQPPSEPSDGIDFEV